MNIEKIEVKERFGHSDKEKAKGMDALFAAINNVGYDVLEQQPKAVITTELIDELYELGYKIVKR